MIWHMDTIQILHHAMFVRHSQEITAVLCDCRTNEDRKGQLLRIRLDLKLHFHGLHSVNKRNGNCSTLIQQAEDQVRSRERLNEVEESMINLFSCILIPQKKDDSEEKEEKRKTSNSRLIQTWTKEKQDAFVCRITFKLSEYQIH